MFNLLLEFFLLDSLNDNDLPISVRQIPSPSQVASGQNFYHSNREETMILAKTKKASRVCGIRGAHVGVK